MRESEPIVIFGLPVLDNENRSRLHHNCCPLGKIHDGILQFNR